MSFPMLSCLQPVAAVFWLSAALGGGEEPTQKVTALPDSVREAFALPSFYKRYVNRTDHYLDLFFLDTAGKRNLVGRLRASDRVEQKTFVGQVWLVAGPGDKPLATVVAPERPGRAVIDDSVGERVRRF